MSDKAAGKTWVLVNPDAHDHAAASISDLLGPELQLADIGAYLDIAQTARTIPVDGPEKAGSTATTKYQAEIDRTKLASVLPPELKQFPARSDASSARSVLVTYWVDRQNRLIKVLVDSKHASTDSIDFGTTDTVAALAIDTMLSDPPDQSLRSARIWTAASLSGSIRQRRSTNG